MFAHLLTRHTAGVSRRATRRFACLAVRVDYGTLHTSMDDLRGVFERVGSVWDVLPIESKAPGRILKSAIVRYYVGEFTPASTLDAAPLLPPPTPDEISEVKATVRKALAELNLFELNGKKLRVREFQIDDPNQLHEWYKDKQIEQEIANQRVKHEIFPTSPFHSPARKGDDYRQGFLAGFNLGMKDGSKYRS
ncbi:hypothetical protein GGH94_003462 [Coemansia aciculifera]|uniref:Uncharacterized protein n=1 Tax=Coemansia aciculifera TaxID=417176 RepID=A0A9W8IR32_9FUNG|nr:hypothetical protein GGH94_003462 [Coemansia aciculifera]